MHLSGDLCYGDRLLLRWLRLVSRELFGIWGSGAGGAEEEFAAVGERHVARVCPQFGMVAGLIAVDDNLGTYGESVFVGPSPEECVRTSTFDHPDFLGAVRLDDLDMNPGMGIDPFDFDD